MRGIAAVRRRMENIQGGGILGLVVPILCSVDPPCTVCPTLAAGAPDFLSIRDYNLEKDSKGEFLSRARACTVGGVIRCP